MECEWTSKETKQEGPLSGESNLSLESAIGKPKNQRMILTSTPNPRTRGRAMDQGWGSGSRVGLWIRGGATGDMEVPWSRGRSHVGYGGVAKHG